MRTKLLVFVLAAATLLAACGSSTTTAVPTPTADGRLDTMIVLLEKLVENQSTSETLPTQEVLAETPEPTPVVELTVQVEPTEYTLVDAADNENGLPIREFEWGRGNIPESVVTIKTNTTGGCTMPEVVCYMLDDEGVLGADDYAEAMANPSAIWTGSAWHQMAQGPLVGFEVPEGSYATWYSISSTVDGGGYHLEFDPKGPGQCMGVLVRGWFAETHVDRHIPITITNYGALGAMIYTRYPVPVEAGQFFSQDYLTDQAKNALDFDNSGIGDEDCEKFWQYVLDFNDGSLTELTYTVEAGWELVSTNVAGHGRN